jgi:RNA recognition motif-containing protein
MFSTPNPSGSAMFPEASAPAVATDRDSGSIWSNNATQSNQRLSSIGIASDPRSNTWGNYQGAGVQAIPEFQPNWGYGQQHSLHLRDSHSVWTQSEHEHSWKYSRAQAPPHPPTSAVWQYPTSSQHQEFHAWGARGQAANEQAGYYYVPSSHEPRNEDYIPYDIGARRAYHQAAPHIMPPPPPGYPMPPHMQYYGQATQHSPIIEPTQTFHLSPAQMAAVPSSSPQSAPTRPGGAASFLFEAAAAAMSKGPNEDKAVSPSLREDKNSSPAEKKSEHDSNIERTNLSSSAQKNRNTQRVNNHQMRLHGSGNEKTPLSTVSNSGQVTTLMIRNIPNRYTQSELLNEIRESGFDNKFDFFYLPMDHETHANFGYAFINFLDDREVDPFTTRFNGLKLNRFTSNKIIQIVPAQLQGFQANLQHYCKKAVCTDDNIDYRPLFFVDGKCLEFHRASEFTDLANKTAASRGTTPISPRNSDNVEATRRIAGGRATSGKVFQQRRNKGE